MNRDEFLRWMLTRLSRRFPGGNLAIRDGRRVPIRLEGALEIGVEAMKNGRTVRVHLYPTAADENGALVALIDRARELPLDLQHLRPEPPNTRHYLRFEWEVTPGVYTARDGEKALACVDMLEALGSN